MVRVVLSDLFVLIQLQAKIVNFTLLDPSDDVYLPIDPDVGKFYYGNTEV